MTNENLFKRKLRKKTEHITKNKDESQQKEIAEKHLEETLAKLCVQLDIRLEEWDINKKLFEAVVKSRKIVGKRAQQICEMYDTSYRLVKKLGLKVSSKYRWFTNINEITQQN
jgi:hypothetical protein